MKIMYEIFKQPVSFWSGRYKVERDGLYVVGVALTLRGAKRLIKADRKELEPPELVYREPF